MRARGDEFMPERIVVGPTGWGLLCLPEPWANFVSWVRAEADWRSGTRSGMCCPLGPPVYKKIIVTGL
jgi:hypothetical protein